MVTRFWSINLGRRPVIIPFTQSLKRFFLKILGKLFIIPEHYKFRRRIIDIVIQRLFGVGHPIGAGVGQSWKESGADCEE